MGEPEDEHVSGGGGAGYVSCLPGTVPIDAWCPGVIVTCRPFHSQECPGLNDKVRGPPSKHPRWRWQDKERHRVGTSDALWGPHTSS